MFHVELRRFPHVSRTFNLTREELEEQVVRPWIARAPFEHDERQWEPARSKLAIYEAPAVQAEEMGLGRGWATVTKTGEDVTAAVLDAAHASVERFKAAVISHGRMTLADVVAIAGRSHPQARVSDRLALAERAVWELLHQRRLALSGPQGPIERDQWSAVLLRWESWTDPATTVGPVS